MVSSSACTIYYMYTAGTMFNYMYIHVHSRNNFNLHEQDNDGGLQQLKGFLDTASMKV